MFSVGTIRRLPPFMREYRELAAYFDAVDEQLYLLNQTVLEYWNARLAGGCSERLLGRLERSFGIAEAAGSGSGVGSGSGLSSEARRNNIIAVINSRPPITEATVHNILHGIYGDNYFYALSGYTLTITARRNVPQNITALYKRLRELIPANIALTVTYTVNTYGDLEGISYDVLSAYTYDGLMYDEIIA